MRTTVHLIVSLIIVAALYPIFSWKVLLIFVGGVLIDVDHYLWYVYKYRKFSLFGCYEFFTVATEKNKWKYIIGILLVFHTIEFLLLVVLLAFYSEYVLIFGIGLFGHYILDLIFILLVAKRFIIDHSVTHWYYKNKIQKV